MNRYSSKRMVTFLLAVIFILASIIPAMATGKFSDIEGHAYEQILQEWIDKGYIKGDSDGNVRPDDPVTRAEFMALVNRSLGLEETEEASFADVSEDAWYYNDVLKAVKKGYMQGYAGNMFPDNNITRQELATVLSRLGNLDTTVDEELLNTLLDVKLIPNWSKGAISATLAENLFEDFVGKRFKPTENVTRVEVVVILDRFLKSLEEELEEEEVAGDAPTIPGGGWWTPPVVRVSGVSVDQEDQLLLEGLTLKLTATISPANATNKRVTWASSDEAIASVDKNGEVKAVGKGTAIITVTTADGSKTGTITITVPIVVDNVTSLEQAIENAEDGDTILLSAGRYVLKKTLVIKKSIKILGPQANVDPRPSVSFIRTDDKDEAILTGDTGDTGDYTSQAAAKEAGWLASIFEIRAHNVVINGLTLERTYNHIIYSQTADPTGGDDREHDIVGLQIINNIVRHGRGNEGIKIGRSIDALVQYNYVHDILHPGDAIEAYDVRGFRILDNEIDGCNSINGNIRVSNRAGGGPGIVRGNIIKNTGYHFAINAEDGNGNTIIDNNTIINAKAGGIFVYKNTSVSEENPTLIEITNNTINGYGTNPVTGTDYRERYLREAASAIAVSFNLGAGIQPIVTIAGNTTITGNNAVCNITEAEAIPVLCFGGGTPVDDTIPTDLSRITVSGNTFDNVNVKHIKTEGVLVLPGGNLQAAIDTAQDDAAIYMAAGQYEVTGTINVNKPVTIKGAAEFASKIITNGGNPVFNLSAAATLDGIFINKTDKTSQHLVIIAADDATIKDSKFLGQYVQGDSEVARAIVPNAGITGYTLSGNHFESLRQPAYLEGAGTVTDNFVKNTRGWVVCVNHNVAFTNNTFEGNAVDIAIIANNQTDSEYYKDIAAISFDNNGAYVENQLLKVSAKDGSLFVEAGGNANANSIENAVAAAKAGDTILISGNFGGFVANKPLTIIGGNIIPAKLLGEPAGIYVTTAGSGTVIDGVTITGTIGSRSMGIVTQANTLLTVKNSVLTKLTTGIYLNPGSVLTATGNTINGTVAGIGSDKADLTGTVSGNIFNNCESEGIGLYLPIKSDRTEMTQQEAEALAETLKEANTFENCTDKVVKIYGL